MSKAMAALANCVGISIPGTEEVQRQILEGGSQVTPRDIAVGIISRLLGNPSNSASEVLFLREYLEIPPFLCSSPVELLQKLGSQNGNLQQTDFALSTISGGTRGGVGPHSCYVNGRRSRKLKTWDGNVDKVPGDRFMYDRRELLRRKTWAKTPKAAAPDDLDAVVELLPGQLGDAAAHFESESPDRPAKEQASPEQKPRPRCRSESPRVKKERSLRKGIHVGIKLDVARRFSDCGGLSPIKSPACAEVQKTIPACFQAPESGHHMEEGLDDWDFNIFKLAEVSQNRPLQTVGWDCLLRHNLVDTFHIDSTKGMAFLSKSEGFYFRREAVPYHNNVHAADVTQTVHSLMYSFGLGKVFNSTNKLSLLLGAVIHDMGHDGRNNAFHVAVQDDLALTYNDTSVLENFHLAQGFHLLLKDASSNFLADFRQDAVVKVRKEMIKNVLATDMAQHMMHMGVFRGLVEKLGSSPEDWIAEGSAAVHEMEAMILHAADVGTSSKPLVLSDKWAQLLQEEFYAQGDEELDRGMNVSPLCDRRNKFASSQTGFIQFIVQPVFALLGQTAPLVQSVIVEHHLKASQGVWQGRASLEQVEPSEVEEVKSLAPVKEVKRFVGRGQFGVVFGCALEGDSEAEVAVKLLAKDVRVGVYKEREINLLKSNAHPNIVRLIEVVSSGSSPKALMLEFCTGGTLDSLVHKVAKPNGETELGVASRLQCVLDVSSAVEFLHGRNVIHRDVTPANCFLTRPFSSAARVPPVKLGDLGLSHATSASASVYMAPEVALSQEFDLESDVYSLAISLHEVLTGKQASNDFVNLEEEYPQEALSPVEGMRPSLEELPECSGLGEIKSILSISWSEDPRDRLTAAEFRERLSMVSEELLAAADAQ